MERVSPQVLQPRHQGREVGCSYGLQLESSQPPGLLPPLRLRSGSATLWTDPGTGWCGGERACGRRKQETRAARRGASRRGGAGAQLCGVLRQAWRVRRGSEKAGRGTLRFKKTVLGHGLLCTLRLYLPKGTWSSTVPSTCVDTFSGTCPSTCLG